MATPRQAWQEGISPGREEVGNESPYPVRSTIVCQYDTPYSPLSKAACEIFPCFSRLTSSVA